MHAVRQRQDLGRTDAAERYMNDMSAEEVYEQLLLGFIRAGSDPNAVAVVEEYEGYAEPSYDPARNAEITLRHRATMRDIYHEREVIIRTLRASREHQALPAFDRLLAETEYYTGVREWKGVTGATSLTQRGILSRRALDRDMAALPAVAGVDEDVATTAHLVVTPSYIRGKLRPYQIEGVNWLLSLFARGVNGILADEMGLGKTFQTITLFAYLKFSCGVEGPHLVVCPKSVMGNWVRELRHWCPALSVFKFHVASELRSSVVKSHLQPCDRLRYDVVVTTFEMVLEEINTFRRINWQYLVVDEAHKLKNDESKAHSALSSLWSDHRLIITGTPLQNNLKELWALLHFLAPRLFDDAEAFDAWFNTVSGEQDVAVMSNLHKLLAPLMIRRLKVDVSTGIPPKKEIYVSCQLSKKQREWYMHVLAKDAEVLNRSSSSATSLNNVLMNLRKVINHPFLMDGAEEGPPFVTDERLVRASGKMVILDKLLHRLRADVEGQHKVLIFSQFTSMLNILEDYCHMRGFRYCRIDGNTSGYDRDVQMAAFNAPRSDYFIFLLSTRAGGLGINLQAANHVVLYDSDWNPQMDLQAQDRAHRIGQQRSVRVYRLVTDGTVEEKIYRRALKKLYLDALVVQQGRLQSRISNQVSKEELFSMIKFGAEEVFRSRQEDVTEADIDRLLQDGEAKSHQLCNEAQNQVQMSLASFQLGAEEANIYDFEGISYKAGVESRMLHLHLREPVSQAALQAQCAQYGEVIRVVLHPNLSEALVFFRTTGGAVEAKAKLPYDSTFASRNAQTVVTSEMISECLGAGEKLGRGHRVRETVQFFSEAEVERMQSKAVRAPPLKLPKAPKFRYFQLYNMKRLVELHNTEVALLVHRWKRRYEHTGTGEEASHGGDSTAPQDDTAIPITEEDDGNVLTTAEQEERERLLSEGFATWSYAEYRALINVLSSGKVEMSDYAAIASAIASEAPVPSAAKTSGEVRDYVTALMERGEQCIPRFDRIESRMRKAQQRHQAKADMLRAARNKVESYTRPELELSFKTKGNASLDRQIFLTGYDANFRRGCIGRVIQELPANRFNVWCQSRSEQFFERRLRRLMLSVKREAERPSDELQEPQKSRRRTELTAS